MSGKFGVLNPLRNWKKSDPLSGPTVSIVLNEYAKNSEGFVSISANLATSSEVDYVIDELKKSLEFARQDAKRILQEQQEKILDSLHND
jgi:hypothetical protein